MTGKNTHKHIHTYARTHIYSHTYSHTYMHTFMHKSSMCLTITFKVKLLEFHSVCNCSKEASFSVCKCMLTRGLGSSNYSQIIDSLYLHFQEQTVGISHFSKTDELRKEIFGMYLQVYKGHYLLQISTKVSCLRVILNNEQ